MTDDVIVSPKFYENETETENPIRKRNRISFRIRIPIHDKPKIYRSGEYFSFRDEPKTYLSAQNGQNPRNEIVKPTEAATVRLKVGTSPER